MRLRVKLQDRECWERNNRNYCMTQACRNHDRFLRKLFFVWLDKRVWLPQMIHLSRFAVAVFSVGSHRTEVRRTFLWSARQSGSSDATSASVRALQRLQRIFILRPRRIGSAPLPRIMWEPRVHVELLQSLNLLESPKLSEDDGSTLRIMLWKKILNLFWGSLWYAAMKAEFHLSNHFLLNNFSRFDSWS